MGGQRVSVATESDPTAVCHIATKGLGPIGTVLKVYLPKNHDAGRSHGSMRLVTFPSDCQAVCAGHLEIKVGILLHLVMSQCGFDSSLHFGKLTTQF